ncbi:Riboflavin transport system permease protein RibX [bacterium HR40]|nr:Riboflavin transport system permease protein RibX [bacterium HR40]
MATLSPAVSDQRPRPGMAKPPIAALVLCLLGHLALVAFLLAWWREETAAPFAYRLLLGLAVAVGGIGVGGIARHLARHQLDPVRAFVPALLTLLFGLLALEAVLRAYAVPPGLWPTPSAVFARLWTARRVLLADAWQTFVLEAVVGFGIGVGWALPTALLVARCPFLQRGFMPYAAAFASIPIPAMAPVAVHMFGLGWPSKAAVVAVTVYFPVVVNSVRGLLEVDRNLLDLMRSYAADERTTFWRVRIPNALPFLFTALKLGTALAMIGAIVGEFFGATGQGLGFRIQIEAGRFGFDMVWAAILVASLLGIAWFGLIAGLERRFTGWHVSLRE